MKKNQKHTRVAKDISRTEMSEKSDSKWFKEATDTLLSTIEKRNIIWINCVNKYIEHAKSEYKVAKHEVRNAVLEAEK